MRNIEELREWRNCFIWEGQPETVFNVICGFLALTILWFSKPWHWPFEGTKTQPHVILEKLYMLHWSSEFSPQKCLHKPQSHHDHHNNAWDMTEQKISFDPKPDCFHVTFSIALTTAKVIITQSPTQFSKKMYPKIEILCNSTLHCLSWRGARGPRLLGSPGEPAFRGRDIFSA